MLRRGCAITVVIFLAFAALGSTLHSQSPGAEPGRQSYSSGTTAILVDVVVRDRNGRPVTDLNGDAFELYEDGVVQKVDTFRRVSRGSGIGVGIGWKAAAPTVVGSAAALPPEPSEDDEEPAGTTAIVFDHLTSESLRLAQRATLAYLPAAGGGAMKIGVFATEPGARTLQRYTTDRVLVRRAVASLAPSATSTREEQAQRSEELLELRSQLQSQTESVGAGVVLGSGAVRAQNAAELGSKQNQLRLLQTELNMLRSSDNLDREQRGSDTSQALLQVVRSLAEYPGRKTIVFFSEGLPVSPSLSARLDSVIDAAGRANVTAYAVDAKGLRSTSTSGDLLKEMSSHGDERLRQVASGSTRTDEPLTVAFERIEDTLKLDSRTGLARLAHETGGFLVEQSNDLASAFRRIDEDNQFHYLLTYAPRNTAFDGKFRAIQVKVHRPGASVFARRGYRAVRTPGLAGAASHEASALAVFDGGRLPNTFAVHTGSFSFPEPARPGLTPVLVHVRTEALGFTIDRATSTYAGQAAIVVRVKNAAGQEMQRVGQEYLLTGDAREVDAARRGEIIFYRELDLDAGVYSIESVVFDAVAQHASARVTTLTVPALDSHGMAMSSLVLVNRLEETPGGPEPAPLPKAPLYVGRTLLYPNLGEPVSKATSSELPFYFALYGSSADAAISAQLLRNGQPLAEAPVSLPASTNTRVQHVGKLPISALPSGTYELRIRVKNARQELMRTAFFTLVN
jgi:VWFA-related protein